MNDTNYWIEQMSSFGLRKFATENTAKANNWNMLKLDATFEVLVS